MSKRVREIFERIEALLSQEEDDSEAVVDGPVAGVLTEMFLALKTMQGEIDDLRRHQVPGFISHMERSEGEEEGFDNSPDI